MTNVNYRYHIRKTDLYSEMIDIQRCWWIVELKINWKILVHNKYQDPVGVKMRKRKIKYHRERSQNTGDDTGDTRCSVGLSPLATDNNYSCIENVKIFKQVDRQYNQSYILIASVNSIMSLTNDSCVPLTGFLSMNLYVLIKYTLSSKII